MPQRPADAALERASCDVPRDRRAGLVQPAPGTAARQRLVERFRDAINRARSEVAEAYHLRDVQPIPLHGGERESELRQRLVEAGPEAERQLDHVLAVLLAEAHAKRTVKWLGWSAGRSWVDLLQRTPQDARGGKESAFDTLDQAAEDLKRGEFR